MLLVAGVCLAMVPGVASAAKAKQVTVRGNTLEYGVAAGAVKALAGTKVSVAENPKLKTVSKADGSFSLKVPAKLKVTLVANAADHLVTYSPTQTRSASDRNSDFYLPSIALARGLADYLKVPLNAARTAPKDCLVGTSTNVKAVRGLTTPQQIAAFGPIGLAGAQVTMKGAKDPWRKPLHFNSDGIPDRSFELTTKAGASLFVGVPAGTYTVSASKAGSKFEQSFTATCKPGRYILGGFYER